MGNVNKLGFKWFTDKWSSNAAQQHKTIFKGFSYTLAIENKIRSREETHEKRNPLCKQLEHIQHKKINSFSLQPMHTSHVF